jgi:hypothetical protein
MGLLSLLGSRCRTTAPPRRATQRHRQQRHFSGGPTKQNDILVYECTTIWPSPRWEALKLRARRPWRARAAGRSSWGEAGEASRCALLLLALPVLAAAAASLHGAACYATKVPVIDRADVSRTCRCSSSW